MFGHTPLGFYWPQVPASFVMQDLVELAYANSGATTTIPQAVSFQDSVFDDSLRGSCWCSFCIHSGPVHLHNSVTCTPGSMTEITTEINSSRTSAWVSRES